MLTLQFLLILLPLRSPLKQSKPGMIKKLQQLGQSRPKQPVSLQMQGDIDLDDKDYFGDLNEDNEFSYVSKNNKNDRRHGHQAVMFDDFDDDFGEAADSGDMDELFKPKVAKKPLKSPPARNPAAMNPVNMFMQGGYSDEDDDDDFGTKAAVRKRLDDDTPPEDLDKAVNDNDDGDDSDLAGLDFDIAGAAKDQKKLFNLDEQAQREAEEKNKKEAELKRQAEE